MQRQQQVADLDSVEARNLEIGLRYSSQRFNADVSIYQLDQDNVIIRDTDFFNIDGTKTTSSGIEFSFGYEFSDRWSTQITGNYVEHKYDSDQFLGDININGNDIDTAPKWQGNVFLNWQPIEALSMQLNLAHVDEYFLEPENQRVYPGHTLLNLRGRYQITNRLQASVRLTNLTDRRYAERADFTSFTNERYFPGEPRSVFAEIEYQFN